MDRGVELRDLPDELLFALDPQRDVSKVIETMIADARAYNDPEPDVLVIPEQVAAA